MNRKERKNFMKPYESYMIISDLDGTIIPHGGCVSEANKIEKDKNLTKT